MHPPEDLHVRADVETTNSADAKKRTSHIRKSVRSTMYALIVFGGCVIGMQNHFAPPETTHGEPEYVTETEDGNHEDFSRSDDGNIFGRSLLYSPASSGKPVLGKFFKGSNGLALHINGHVMSSKELIPAPPVVLKIFNISNDPKLLIRGLSKEGANIVIDLNIRESQCLIPASAILTIAESIERDPAASMIVVPIPYTLRGRICQIPGMETSGTQPVTFAVEKAERVALIQTQ